MSEHAGIETPVAPFPVTGGGGGGCGEGAATSARTWYDDFPGVTGARLRVISAYQSHRMQTGAPTTVEGELRRSVGFLMQTLGMEHTRVLELTDRLDALAAVSTCCCAPLDDNELCPPCQEARR